MENTFLRHYKPNALIAFILITGTITSIIIGWISKSFSFGYFQYPTASTIVAGILIIKSEWLWKYKPFCVFFWTPNMSGRYEGEISFFNPISKQDERKLCTVEVYQTGSKIKVNSYFQRENGQEKSPSKSIYETIVKNNDDSFSIVYTYQNEGIPNKFSPHNGTNILHFIENEDGTFLKGAYYTNREPQTKGIMEVKLVSNKLKNDY
jgi:hypothetical protein